MKNDKIIIEIKCNSKTCDNLREDGLFFETVAGALGIKRADIKEINTKENYDKSRSD